MGEGERTDGIVDPHGAVEVAVAALGRDGVAAFLAATSSVPVADWSVAPLVPPPFLDPPADA